MSRSEAIQAKGKKKNRYVIKVKQEWGAVPLARKNQGVHQAFSLVVG
jgi:hypothetical protein